MTEPLVVVGMGGFAREVLDVVDAVNALPGGPQYDVVGVLDDGPSDANLERLRARGIAYLGPVDQPAVDLAGVLYCVGVGATRARRTIVEKLDRAGAEPATLVHPTATMGFGVSIGVGSVVCAGVRMTTNIAVGRHVHLNLNVTVGHDTVLGDFVSVNPLASISGDCTVEDGVLVGVAGVVLNGLTVGAGATVGGSACVVRNVPAEMVVKGVPAK